MDNSKSLLPVTVISGFLGSGKTTLLNHLLSLRHRYRVAVLVNDMGEVNVDAELIASGQLSVKKTKEKLVEMHNGCICCTLREDLMREIAKLSRSGKYDYLLIESSGISEPLPIAQAFSFENDQVKKQGIALTDLARLDTMVTVVDASNFINQIQSNEHFEELNLQKKMDQVPLSQLLLDQVEFANVIVLNKTDLVGPDQLAYIRKLVKCLNPTAKIIESSYSKVPAPELINTRSFNMESAQTTTKWIAELQKPLHVSETDEYNIQSCAFKARVPFHPQRLMELLNRNDQPDPGFWSGILRAKGFIWIARKDSFKVELQKAGNKLNYSPNEFWWVSLPKQQWDEDPEEIKRIELELQPIWLAPPIGDKRQEIIFIGQNLQKKLIMDEFGKALMTQEEYQLFDETNGQSIEDVFPKEWNNLEKYYVDQGIVREQDGDWEDEWE